jgi:large subunit ribosomal protein L9
MALMDVILLERVEKLGQMGDIVKVKYGYARNFLLPKKKALRASEENKRVFEAQRAHIEAENLKRKDEAVGVAAKLEGTSVVLIRQAGDTGQLYGSVSARDVAEALGTTGFNVGKNQAVLDKPIKTLGIHKVRIVLHPEVSVGITANVARSAEEAALQAKGVDVMAQQAEEERAEAEAAAAQAAAARAELMADSEETFG